MDARFVTHEPTSGRPGDVLRHYVGDLVFGASDGIVTTFAAVSGVAGADLGGKAILVVGMANLLADGFSMGASNYLAIRSAAGAERVDRGRAEPLRHAAATFAAFLGAGALPLLPFLVDRAATAAFAVSCAATAAALFAVGSVRSLVVPRRWPGTGLEMLGIGAAASAVAYVAGACLASVLR